MRGVLLIGTLVSLLVGGLLAMRKSSGAADKAHGPGDSVADAADDPETPAAGVHAGHRPALSQAAGLRADLERDLEAQRADEEKALHVEAD